MIPEKSHHTKARLLFGVSKQVLLWKKTNVVFVQNYCIAPTSHLQLQFVAETKEERRWYAIDRAPSSSIDDEPKFVACATILCGEGYPGL